MLTNIPAKSPSSSVVSVQGFVEDFNYLFPVFFFVLFFLPLLIYLPFFFACELVKTVGWLASIFVFTAIIGFVVGIYYGRKSEKANTVKDTVRYIEKSWYGQAALLFGIMGFVGSMISSWLFS